MSDFSNLAQLLNSKDMKVETKEIYKCDFCRKLYQVKTACENHEVSCSENPDNERACFGCEFLTKKENTIYEDSPMGGEYKFTRQLLYCNKKEIFVYPPKVEHKGNAIDLGDETNEPMPRQCEFNTNQADKFNLDQLLN